MKSAALSIRIKPLGIDGLGKERLKRKVVELWNELVRCQTEVYDLEEVARRQEYDVSVQHWTDVQDDAMFDRFVITWFETIPVQGTEGATKAAITASCHEIGIAGRGFNGEVSGEWNFLVHFVKYL